MLLRIHEFALNIASSSYISIIEHLTGAAPEALRLRNSAYPARVPILTAENSVVNPLDKGLSIPLHSPLTVLKNIMHLAGASPNSKEWEYKCQALFRKWLTGDIYREEDEP